MERKIKFRKEYKNIKSSKKKKKIEDRRIVIF